MADRKRYFTWLLLAMVLMMFYGCAKKQDSLEELLILGQKYLTEENYEEAVVAFEKAIAADEKSVEAYIGLADAYAGQGNAGKAVEILEQGYGLTQDEALIEKKTEIESETGAGETGEEGEAAGENGTGQKPGDGNGSQTGGGQTITVIEASPVLDELKSLLETSDYEKVGELLGSEYIEKLVEAADGNVVLPLSGDPVGATGTGIGIYMTPWGWYGIYRGDYGNGMRIGDGVWIFGYGWFEGEWAGDAPNGYGRMNSSTGIKEGMLKDGKWEGEVVSNSAVGYIWTVEYKDGIPIVRGEVDEADLSPGDTENLIISKEMHPYLTCSADDLDTPWGIPGFVPETK